MWGVIDDLAIGGDFRRNLADRPYWAIGDLIGGIGWLTAFVASWWYCAATYGYLFGFGLGWLPSFILATMAAIGLKLLWGPLVLLACGLAFMLFGLDQSSSSVVATRAHQLSSQLGLKGGPSHPNPDSARPPTESERLKALKQKYGLD